MAGLLLLARGAAAAPLEDWREHEQLTGDWGGVRARLAERGIEPWAEYTSGFWANLDGGFDTGVRYEGFADWGVDVDLGTLSNSASWADTSFHINWISYHGGQPSEDLVGAFSINFVSGLEAEDSVRFYQVFLEHEFFDGTLVLLALLVTHRFFLNLTRTARRFAFVPQLFAAAMSPLLYAATPALTRPVTSSGAIGVGPNDLNEQPTANALIAETVITVVSFISLLSPKSVSVHPARR